MLCRFNLKRNDKMRISYGMQKSYGSTNHKVLHQVYELDTGNPRIYMGIFSKMDAWKQHQNGSKRITYSGSNFLTDVVRILAKAEPL
jgi:hypothetical protein